MFCVPALLEVLVHASMMCQQQEKIFYGNFTYPADVIEGSKFGLVGDALLGWWALARGNAFCGGCVQTDGILVMQSSQQLHCCDLR